MCLQVHQYPGAGKSKLRTGEEPRHLPLRETRSNPVHSFIWQTHIINSECARHHARWTEGNRSISRRPYTDSVSWGQTQIYWEAVRHWSVSKILAKCLQKEELLSTEGSKTCGRGDIWLGRISRAWPCSGTRNFSGKGNVCGKDTGAVN